ncbi:MAG: hypothetical protein K9J27_04180 [Bacteroidales bacterium]|nr:hypothetical protein [Bacteroidales bacterium]
MLAVYRITTILVLGILASCSGNLGPREYLQWVENEDNGLRVRQATTEATYSLQYEPAEYKALKSMERDAINQTNLMANEKRFSSLHHFLLKIRPKKHQFDSDDALIEYLAYELEDNIQFIRGRDTLKRTVMYHLESPTGVKPYYHILLAYPRTDSQEDLKLKIKNNRLDTNEVKFVFSRSLLNNLPGIKIGNE